MLTSYVISVKKENAHVTPNLQWLATYTICFGFYHQEARVVAEKAATAAKVEEKVNIAVAAANKAATAARVAAVRAVQNQMRPQNGNVDITVPVIRGNNDNRKQKYAV